MARDAHPYVALAVLLYLSILFLINDNFDQYRGLRGMILLVYLSPSILVPSAIYLWRCYLLTQAAQPRFDAQRMAAWNQAKEDTLEKARREARDTTTTLRALLEASSQVRTSLFASLDRAQAALDLAVEEHAARAIPPFWICIENAAAALAEYDQGITQLVDLAHQYYRRLALREHNFPPFPYVSTDLPSEEAMIARFKEVVRMGDEDYEFSMIRTLRQGFVSLERAITHGD